MKKKFKLAIFVLLLSLFLIPTSTLLAEDMNMFQTDQTEQETEGFNIPEEEVKEHKQQEADGLTAEEAEKEIQKAQEALTAEPRANLAEMTVNGTTTAYATVGAALQALPANATASIKLLGDSLVDGKGSAEAAVPAGNTVTIDLNGHKLAFWQLYLDPSTKQYQTDGMRVKGNLIINDTSASGTGGWYMSGAIPGTYYSSAATIRLEGGGNLTVNGGSIYVNSTDAKQINGNAIYVEQSPTSTVTINGGTVNGMISADQSYPMDFVMTGGVVQTSPYKMTTLCEVYNVKNLTITGGKVSHSGTLGVGIVLIDYNNKKATLNVSGNPYFEAHSTSNRTEAHFAYHTTAIGWENMELIQGEKIKGGTFSPAMPEEEKVLLADGYLSQTNSDGTSTVVEQPRAVKVEGLGGFDTVKEAIDAIAASPSKTGTVQLLEDRIETFGGNEGVPAGSDVTIDLNGHLLSWTSQFLQTYSNGMIVHGNLTIDDTSSEKTGVMTTDSSNCRSAFQGTIIGQENAKITIKNGTVRYNFGISANITLCTAILHEGNGEVIIENGTIDGLVASKGSGSLTMSGGEITGNGKDGNIFGSVTLFKSVNITGGTIQAKDHPIFRLSSDSVSLSISGNPTFIGSGNNFDGYVSTITEGDGISGGTFTTALNDEEQTLITEGYAQEVQSDGSGAITTAVATVNGKGFTSVRKALDSIETEGTITLLKDQKEMYDVQDNADLYTPVPEGKTITLDLNGHQLEWGSYYFDSNYVLDGFAVLGHLIVDDSSSEKNGVFTSAYTGNSVTTNDISVITLAKNGTVTLKNGTIRELASVGSFTPAGIYLGRNVTKEATVEITGGTLEGVIYGINGKESPGRYIMSGGRHISSGNARTFLAGYISDVEITGGRLECNGRFGMVISGNGTLNISGDPVLSCQSTFFTFNDVSTVTGEGIRGGTFTPALTATTGEQFIAEGYMQKVTDGTGTIVEAVAKVGDISYPSVREALDSIATEGTVTLLRNHKEVYDLHTFSDAYIPVPAGKTITLDLNGHQLEWASYYYISSGGQLYTDGFFVLGNLIVDDTSNEKNGVLMPAYTGESVRTDTLSAVVIDQNGTLTLKNGKILEIPAVDGVTSAYTVAVLVGASTTDNTKVEINGGTMEGSIYHIDGYGSASRYVMTGGSHISSGNGKTFLAGYMRDVEITGGRIESTGNMGIMVSQNGTLSVSGDPIITAKATPLIFKNMDTVTGPGISGGTYTPALTQAIADKVIAEGYRNELINGGASSKVVRRMVAEVGSTQYYTVKEAFDAASSGATVKLIDNSKEAYESVEAAIPEGKTITLDLNGYRLSYSGVTYDKALGYNVAGLGVEGTLIIEDHSDAQNGILTAAKENIGNTNIGDASPVILKAHGNVTVNSGNLSSEDTTLSHGIMLQAETTSGNVVEVNGGTIYGTIVSFNSYSTGNGTSPSDATLKMSGGAVIPKGKSNYPTLSNMRTMEITGGKVDDQRGLALFYMRTGNGYIPDYSLSVSGEPEFIGAAASLFNLDFTLNKGAGLQGGTYTPAIATAEEVLIADGYKNVLINDGKSSRIETALVVKMTQQDNMLNDTGYSETFASVKDALIKMNELGNEDEHGNIYSYTLSMLADSTEVLEADTPGILGGRVQFNMNDHTITLEKEPFKIPSHKWLYLNGGTIQSKTTTFNVTGTLALQKGATLIGDVTVVSDGDRTNDVCMVAMLDGTIKGKTKAVEIKSTGLFGTQSGNSLVTNDGASDSWVGVEALHGGIITLTATKAGASTGTITSTLPNSKGFVLGGGADFSMANGTITTDGPAIEVQSDIKNLTLNGGTLRSQSDAAMKSSAPFTATTMTFAPASTPVPLTVIGAKEQGALALDTTNQAFIQYGRYSSVVNKEQVVDGYLVVGADKDGYYHVLQNQYGSDEMGVVEVDAETFYQAQTPLYSDGYVFAGWYNQALSDADLENFDLAYTTVPTTGTVYAKFVPEDVLSVKAQLSAGTTAASAQTNLRVLTTVDSLVYDIAGFEFQTSGNTTDLHSTTVYETIVATDTNDSFTSTPSIFHNKSKYFMTVTITDIAQANFDSDITIRPYWVTMDGTKVYGKQRTLKVSEGFGKTPYGV